MTRLSPPPELLRWNMVVLTLLVLVTDFGAAVIERPFCQMMQTMTE